MKKQSVNEAFILLDRTLVDKHQLALRLNKDYKDPSWAASCGSNWDYDPEGKTHKKNDDNPLLWETTVEDHNGYFNVFLFKTLNVYRNTDSDYENVIREGSELRKVLIKNDIAEVGITIEDSLMAPTENVWGYSFRQYKYYIIKDGELTITERRSTIRKVYNNKPIEDNDDYSIRLNDKTTKELFDFYEVGDDVYHCEIDDEEYFIGNDDSMREYFAVYVMDEEFRETLIQMLGGRDAIIENHLTGGTFHPDHFLAFDEGKNFCAVLDINRDWHELNQIYIEYSDFDTDNDKQISGMKLYKKNL